MFAFAALLAALLGVAWGALFFVLWSRERARAETLMRDLRAAETDKARLETQAQHLAQTSSQVEAAFKAMSAEAVAHASQALLKQAEEAFVSRDRLVQAKLEAQLKPVSDSLSKFQAHVVELEAKRNADHGGLRAEIAALLLATTATQDEARRLSSALKRGAGIQGRWGEQMLRNVLEMSGLREGVDFEEQESITDEDGVSRPDFLVRLPGKSFLIVDSKVSLTDYQSFLAASDDVSREVALKAHVDSVRRHLRQLSGKAYWAKFDKPPHSRSPDVVVMFIPSESAFACAVDRHPTLVAEGWESRVAIVTPSAIFPLLRAVAYGWRAEDQARNAAEIASLGRELYKRISVMGAHIAAVGKSIEQAASRYNAFVGSLESQVLTQARRFEDLKVDHGGADIPATPPIEAAIRPLAKLAFPPIETEGGAGQEAATYPTLTLGNDLPTSQEPKQDLAS